MSEVESFVDPVDETLVLVREIHAAVKNVEVMVGQVVDMAAPMIEAIGKSPILKTFGIRF